MREVRNKPPCRAVAGSRFEVKGKQTLLTQMGKGASLAFSLDQAFLALAIWSSGSVVKCWHGAE